MPDDSKTSLLPNQSSPIYVVGGILILVVGSLALGLGYASGEWNTDAFRFITLLVVFMTALAATATIFAGLQMGNRKEAFGLPSGSIRALLAVGIMILFVIFGLPLVSATVGGANDDAPKMIAAPAIPYGRFNDSIVKQYADQNLIAIVTDYGGPDTGDAKTGIVTHPVKIEIRSPDHVSERMDISKQLIGQIITLMASVVSFYFGSRSATDAIRSAQNTDPNSPDPAIRRNELGARIGALKANLASRGQTIDKNKALPGPADTSAIVVRETAEAAVDSRRHALDDQAKAIQDLAASADQSIRAITAASPGDARAASEQAARASLGKLADALAAAEALLPAYDTEIDAYVKATGAA